MLSNIKNSIACSINKMKENYQENDYKVTDIIKESKSTPTGCYFDEVCNVAERK